MSDKNPAVLWYPGDYLVGTMGMTWEEKGRYVELLNLQHQKGLFIGKETNHCFLPSLIMIHDMYV